MTDITETIKGEIDAVRFRADDGYSVIMLKSDGELIPVVGYLGNVEQGEEVVCKGHYEDNRKYGIQFKCEYLERSLPSTVSAIEKYLASGAIKGIGAVKAKAIVKAFGEDTFDVIENTPQRLTEVEGIRRRTAMDIAEQFKKLFAVRGLSVFFAQYNIPMSLAVTAFRRWGEEAEQLIRTNPYMLCSEGLDVSFETADKIAFMMHIPQNSDMRIKAGICSVLREQLAEKHTCMPVEYLAMSSCEKLGIGGADFYRVLTEQLTEEELFRYDKPDGRYIMLRDYFKAENYISRRLSAMRSCSYDNKIDFSEVINETEREYGITYDKLQREAINLSLSYGFMVLTGGPGTGKTTTLNAIIKLFRDSGLNVMIAAPTGRAAKRISELTGCEAKTIHRLLEVKHTEDDRMSFVHDENDMLDCEALIIDEMSMVDTRLFEAVLRGISLTCKLVLVGDSNQLQSIGAGDVLHDIVESGVMPVVTLTKIFRQAQQSMIITNAHKIVAGGLPDISNRGDGDFFFIPADGRQKLESEVKSLCSERLPSYYSCSAFDDIQVISPTRQGPSSVDTLNTELQNILNPPAPTKSELTAHGTVFRVGDKVMQTKNDYDIEWSKRQSGESESGVGIFNGDIGRIVACNKMLRQLKIDFDGRIATYDQPMLENLELAYAITVHKSQGSEYNIVVLTLNEIPPKLCTRNMIYTAVTRAKKILIIVGTTDCIEKMVNNCSIPHRDTCLKEMLEELDRDGTDGSTALF